MNQDAACVVTSGFIRCTAFLRGSLLQQQSIPMHVRVQTRMIRSPPLAMTPVTHGSNEAMPSNVKLQAIVSFGVLPDILDH